MKIITDLSESKMLPSKTAYRRFTAKQVSELAYMHLLALRILAGEATSYRWAHDYAVKTIRGGHFDQWSANATDLYLLMHALLHDGVEFRLPDASADHLHDLYLDEPKIRAWLNALAHGSSTQESAARRLFSMIDYQFRTKDNSLKAIRRLVLDWPKLSQHEKQLSVTRLLQMMRARSMQSDVLARLTALAKHHHFELNGVCDSETGEGCGTESGSRDSKAHNPSTLAKVAALVAGGALGMWAGKKLAEDDGGAAAAPAIATTSAAPLVKPLGKVRRRAK